MPTLPRSRRALLTVRGRSIAFDKSEPGSNPFFARGPAVSRQALPPESAPAALRRGQGRGGRRTAAGAKGGPDKTPWFWVRLFVFVPFYPLLLSCLPVFSSPFLFSRRGLIL